MIEFPSSSAIILVAVMPSVKDLEIARLLGWYRIPLRFAPKLIEVDYLAFYQTGAFGKDHRWQIKCFSPLCGHELTTRRELIKDEPDHPRADEEYFKLQLGPLIYLQQPIKATHWKRITFLYTTGQHFAAAQKIDDLIIRSNERQILWNTLKERALQAGRYRTIETDQFSLPPELFNLLAVHLKTNETPGFDEV